MRATAARSISTGASKAGCRAQSNILRSTTATSSHQHGVRAAVATSGQHTKLTAVSRSHGRALSANIRADVNWDAFRPSASTGNNAPGAASGTPRARSSTTPSAGTVHHPSYLHDSLRTRQPSPAARQVDFLVIGSGIAGLSYALKVAEYGTVAVVTKDFANEGCTQYAQGGVCAVLDRQDSVAEHVRDTLIAGAFLNDQQAVEVVCREGPARVLELVQMGAEFTTNIDGTLHLTKEGGHSRRRVVHAADMTGKEIERALLATAKAHPNVQFFEHHLATDLVVDEYQGMRHCFGADVLDQRGMTMTRFISLSTMLASGGAGQVYPNTTNPHVATGDGVAMAYRAAAAVSNMEFIQFHPTALYDPTNTGRTFLITEAVRGEGGMLYNLGGERFMSKYDPTRMELAPRDIVARSIHNELMERGDKHVLLDISHKPAHDVMHHFPNIAAKCSELGIDITRDPIPVVPAQHYTCGGVQTGLLGETGVQGLYACGEVTNSGLHGANRLASNSLLEGLVFADRAAGPSVAHAEYALRNCGRQLHYAAATANFSGARGARPASAAVSAWATARRKELRESMWRGCGIVRNVKDMQATLETARTIVSEAASSLETHGVCTELVELHNLATVAEITASCALQRKESRGGHYCVDYPTEQEREKRPSVVQLGQPAAPGRAARVAAGNGGATRLVGPVSVPVLVPAGAVLDALESVDIGGGGGGASSTNGGIKRKKRAAVRDTVMRSLPENEP